MKKKNIDYIKLTGKIKDYYRDYEMKVNNLSLFVYSRKLRASGALKQCKRSQR